MFFFFESLRLVILIITFILDNTGRKLYILVKIVYSLKRFSTFYEI